MSRLLNDLSNLASGNNNRAISHYNLALTSLKQKNYTSAINSFLKALKEDNSPQMQSMVRPNLGQAYILNNDFENAIEELIKVLQLKNTDNGYAFIHSNLGYAYSQLKNYGLAILEYKKSLKYRPDDSKVHYALGMLYESKFQSDLAYGEMEKALQVEPNNQTYINAYNNLQNTPVLSFKVGRLAQPLLTLGIIVAPSYVLKEKNFLPLIIYIYPESPLKKLAREGDYITYVDKAEENKSMIETLNAPPETRLSLMVNKSRVVVNTIPQITRKLDEEEKVALYHNWFNTFDNRIVSIWQMESQTDKEDAGAKWGYEFESLIRSWSAYKSEPLFEAAYSLLMEFFHAYIFSGKDNEVHYEINLSKLNFKNINISIIAFFKEIGFNETAKYLENKIMQGKNENINGKKPVGPIKSTLPKISQPITKRGK